LAALPPHALARLWRRLEPVDCLLHEVLHVPEAAITQVYFPETIGVSLLTYMMNGDAVEVGQVGHEGMVGLPVVLGSDFDDLEAMVQNPGTALRLGAAALREELEHIPELRPLLLRYVLVHRNQVARTAACNSRHEINQRMARWLLMAHDRAEGDEFPMTHEFLSMMLGVRRAGVTVAAGALQKAGAIRYERGRMTVFDRACLEQVACECYRTTRRSAERVLPWRDGGAD